MFCYGEIMDNTKLKIGENIKKYRVLRGITQHELAEIIGLTEKQISKIETGIHYPKFENFVKILDALNISMRDFDTGIETETNSSLRKILRILYNSNEEDLKLYASFFKTVEKIKNKYK